MTTFTAYTKTRGKAPAEALGQLLEDLDEAPTGVGVFEIEDGSGLYEVAAYFEEAPDEVTLALLAMSQEADPFIISELPETDWVAHVKRELTPVEAGRFFVYGSHDADKLPAGRIGLLIEAAMAFGTGHHGTTLGCLRAFDKLVEQGRLFENVADIGAGTAVLGMAAAHVTPNPVIASDIDQQAVDVSRANVVANGLEGRVICLEAAGFAHPDILKAAPFDLVFANILKKPLIGLAPDMKSYVQSGGIAILSGILNEQAEEVIGVYAQNGFNLVEHARIVEWSTLVLERS
ncbi:Ribosomal protein L11 methyltransferase [Aquimixticola soesokkakensis]|uniref:Ribosomal protein L11 methyltransferase n=1 Tax=Aquimixticola soesokkakensis TaxID=1519096 RepID=A0A1Y5S617_9RHOB|nr:50S ribosomal protein L11 methyltransferase [Aquimixticola soesokkakensis]SLN32821.1 Ribosomal protein L11 methyltransferase [Aquimixticola soesokkakensis]